MSAMVRYHFRARYNWYAPFFYEAFPGMGAHQVIYGPPAGVSHSVWYVPATLDLEGTWTAEDA